MANTVHISMMTDSKGNIVAYMQGATFSRAELNRIRAPHRYELWTSRGYSPVAVLYAKDTATAKELARAKFRTRGLELRKVTVHSRRV